MQEAAPITASEVAENVEIALSNIVDNIHGRRMEVN